MKRIIIFTFLLSGISSCVEVLKHESSPDISLIDQLSIPENFDYATARRFELDIVALDNGDKPLKNVVFEYGFLSEQSEIVLGKTVTDINGKSTFASVLPTSTDTLFVRTRYIGLPSETKIIPSTGKNHLTLGGKTSPKTNGTTGGRTNSNGRTEAAFSYIGNYDFQGVPNYLQPVNDYIPQDLLDLVNNTLPETFPVPTNNPQYISDLINPDTRLADSADIWITFVHEGAGYVNAIGYYTYDLANPPTSVSQIAKRNIIFPNVSLPGSGGNLRPGNKVYLGKFPPNTGIGWFLVPNGWNGSGVTEKPEIKYSTKALNTYTQSQYRQQVVLLKDNLRELLLLGFEDLSRPGGDNDFNDAVFFVTANPYSALVNDNKLATAKPATGTDTDGDGIIDRNDSYPTDAQKAFDVYTPGQNIYGSVAFEDQWPAKGDYDLNDLVVDYNFQLVTNASNSVVECRGKFLVRAVGAAYHNGFGIELPIASSLVESVSGTNIRNASIVKNANGTEAGQQNATIILFTDAQSLFNGSTFVNTRDSDPYQTPAEVKMTVRFTSPIKMADLGNVPYNPFLFVNGDRTVEVHLPDYLPTSKANRNLLGTSADSSVPATGRYYKSGSNLPWAINIALSFDYPKESRPVNETHLKFSSWSQTAGGSFKDWYQNKSGYRDNGKLYVKK